MAVNRFEDRSQSRREHRVVDVAEFVDATAQHEPPSIEVDLVLHVGAQLGAVLGRRRDRDVEVVATDIAAVIEHMPDADGRRVARLEVKGLRREIQLQRLSGPGVGNQQVRRLGIKKVGEETDLQRAATVADLAVSEQRARLNVERSDAAVDRTFGARDTTGVAHAAIGQFLIDAGVEFRLTGAGVHVG